MSADVRPHTYDSASFWKGYRAGYSDAETDAGNSDLPCFGCGNETHFGTDHPVNIDGDRLCLLCVCQRYHPPSARFVRGVIVGPLDSPVGREIAQRIAHPFQSKYDDDDLAWSGACSVCGATADDHG